MTRLVFALVGAGSMGALHARVLSSHPHTRLGSIIDTDRVRAAKLAAEFGGEPYEHCDEFPTCDCLVVASPTPSHMSWAMRAIGEGTPVLIEKPISEELAETTKVLNAAHDAGVPVSCGFVERFNPVLCEALRIATDTVHLSVVRHSPYVERIRTGVASDLLIHDIDLALRLGGDDPVRVSSVLSSAHPSSEPGAEDLAEAQLSFGSGLVASLSASRIAQRKVRSATFAELDRSVEADLLRNDLVVYRHIGNALVGEGGGGYRQQTVMEIPLIPPAKEPLVAQLDHFLEIIAGRQDAEAEIRGVLAPHRVLELIRAAARTP